MIWALRAGTRLQSGCVSDSDTGDEPEVVVVGGGIAGVTVALELALRGRRVTVLDKGTPGQAATARSSGGIRRQFATAIEIDIVSTSVPLIERVIADLAFDGAVDRFGYAFLATDSTVERLAAAWRLQQERGVPSRWLSRNEIADLFPYVDCARLAGATWSSADFFVDPWALHRLIVRKAQAAGVRLIEDCEVTSLRVEGGTIREVGANGWTFRPAAVVNAAGAWAGAVHRLAGRDLAIRPLPRVKFITSASAGFPRDMPLITDLETTAFVRREAEGAIVGVAPRRHGYGWDFPTSQEDLAWMIERAVVAFPGLRDARIAHLVTGWYEATPDGLPVVGVDTEISNLYVLGGFNGHGIMFTPALAAALAAEVQGSAPDPRWSSLRPGRFSGDALEDREATRTDLL